MADLPNPELALAVHNLHCYAAGGARWAFAVLAELKRLAAENAALRPPAAARYEIQPGGERLDGTPADYGADGD